jgi:putative transposase
VNRVFQLQTGIRLKARPTDLQKQTLSQWIGCARVIWNAKCDEHKYFSAFARKNLPIGTYAPLDQAFALFKDKELTPWLSDCPSQILRNSAVSWYQTYQRFFKKLCNRPVRKKRTSRGSIHLTRELFRFEECDDGVTRLFIGSKTNNIGYLSFTAHRSFGEPNSIRIVRDAGNWFVSFSYETEKKPAETAVKLFASPEEQIEWLHDQSEEWLTVNIQGHDRGAAIPLHSVTETYDFTPEQKRSKKRAGKKSKRLQKQMARQAKGSNRRKRTKERFGSAQAKIKNIRKDFCHKTSTKIVAGPALINVFEDLKIKNMTKRPKAKKDANGKFLPNGAAAKAGLTKVLLEPGLGQLVEFVRYKSVWAGKLLLLVAPHYTSQECACCGYVDADSRRSQALFECTQCGHRDHADRNAGIVIGKRAVSQIRHPGTGLSARGVLSKGTPSDTGRPASDKTSGARVPAARGGTVKTEASEVFLLEDA